MTYLKSIIASLAFVCMFSTNAMAMPTFFIGSQGAGTLTSARTDFQNYFGGPLTLESFETAFAAAPSINFPIGGPTEFTATLNAGGSNFSHSATFFTDGSLSLRTNSMTQTEFDFGTGINAFGIDISDIDSGAGQSFGFSIDGGAFNFVGNGSVSNNRYFVGIVSDTAFSTITFTSSVADNSGFDRLEFGTESSSVPEPESLAIFGLGIAALGFARRQRKAA